MLSHIGFFHLLLTSKENYAIQYDIIFLENYIQMIDYKCLIEKEKQGFTFYQVLNWRDSHYLNFKWLGKSFVFRPMEMWRTKRIACSKYKYVSGYHSTGKIVLNIKKIETHGLILPTIGRGLKWKGKYYFGKSYLIFCWCLIAFAKSLLLWLSLEQNIEVQKKKYIDFRSCMRF